MNSLLTMSEKIQSQLRCPVCRAKMVSCENALICLGADCGISFPIIGGVPVLINEGTSVFSISDIIDKHNNFFEPPKRGKIVQTILNIINPSLNIEVGYFFQKFHEILCADINSPVILVIGGATLGQGMEDLVADTTIELVESDIWIGPRTILVCDAQDIPFENASFDAVIAQAVLEHVADPTRCMREIHRVLKEGGLVYACTPFMQQVHGGPYDFTRFTHLGHRRLFRQFEEIDSAIAGGPGMALAWSYQYFLLSFSKSKFLRKYIKLFSSITSFYLKYFDYYLIHKDGAFDAASGFHFIGRKSILTLSDQELIKLYRGAF